MSAESVAALERFTEMCEELHREAEEERRRQAGGDQGAEQGRAQQKLVSDSDASGPPMKKKPRVASPVHDEEADAGESAANPEQAIFFASSLDSDTFKQTRRVLRKVKRDFLALAGANAMLALENEAYKQQLASLQSGLTQVREKFAEANDGLAALTSTTSREEQVEQVRQSSSGGRLGSG